MKALTGSRATSARPNELKRLDLNPARLDSAAMSIRAVYPDSSTAPSFGYAPFTPTDRSYMDRSFPPSFPSIPQPERSREQLWRSLDELYSKNEDTIRRAMSLDIKLDKKLQNAMESFVETANVILDGLVALGKVHPVLGSAISAFHGVIKLDLTRRDSNNRKVLAVKLQMQSMMCAMFQLRTFRRPHNEDSTQWKDGERLQELVRVITDDITNCGSDLNYYINRKLVSRLINVRGYERRFAQHIAAFVQRRTELQVATSACISGRIDAVSAVEVGKLDTHAEQKLDGIIAIFRKFDTPRERDCRAFVDANGGPQACIATDSLLAKLLSKSSDMFDAVQSAALQETLADMRKVLSAEISEDLELTLTNNQQHFKTLLNMQNSNLECSSQT